MEATKRSAGPTGHMHMQMVRDFLTLAAMSVAVGLATSVAVGGLVLLLSRPVGVG